VSLEEKKCNDIINGFEDATARKKKNVDNLVIWTGKSKVDVEKK
jgi:hypothetical protein